MNKKRKKEERKKDKPTHSKRMIRQVLQVKNELIQAAYFPAIVVSEDTTAVPDGHAMQVFSDNLFPTASASTNA
jgi:hypothetical protein